MAYNRKQAYDIAREHKNITVRSVCNFKSVSIKRREIRIFDEFYNNLSDENKYDISDSVAEWILDNYEIIKDRAGSLNKDLKNILHNLPLLKESSMAGFPRVFAMAVHYADMHNGRIKQDELTEFLIEYQNGFALTMSELWALNTVFETVLVKNILTVSARRNNFMLRKQRIAETATEYCNNNRISASNFVNMNDTLELAEFINFVQEKSIDLQPIYRLEDELRNMGLDSHAVLDYAGRIESDNAVTLKNTVISLLSLSKFNWEQIFSNVSIADAVFNECSSSVFRTMDTQSKNIYREQLAKYAEKNKMSEPAAANMAAKKADERNCDVGMVLFDKKERKRLRKFLYVFSLYAVAAALWCMFLFVFGTLSNIYASVFIMIATVVPCICISEIAVNSVACKIIRPKRFCRIDFSKGLPNDCKTVILIPALLNNVQIVKALVDRMESNYIANRSENLSVVLLGDYAQADSCNSIDDEKIKSVTCDSIRKLNEKYGKKIFYYFQRKRTYNPSQKVYMGWERKRGAVTEFNRFVTKGDKEGFSYICDGTENLMQTKYIVTLDSDTVTPFESVLKLVGTLHHPLNRPVFDVKTHKIVAGYGILQPRMETGIVSASKTEFAKIMSGSKGTAPYTTGVFESYQDIFGKGNFSGKGIYSPEVFLNVLDGRFAENSVLSHDMIEGVYLNSGYVSDIELIDEIPSNYISYRKRMHRWVRGDWQLLPFIKSYVRNQSGETVKNTADNVSKLKIIQNLRRTLFYPNIGILSVAGIFDIKFLYIAFLAMVIAETVPLLFKLYGKIRIAFCGYACTEKSVSDIKLAFANIVFAMDNAVNNIDAILRTLYRLKKRTNLLEWQTAHQAEIKSDKGIVSYYRTMLAGTLAGFILLASGFASVNVLRIVSGVLFVSAPFVAFVLSQSKEEKGEVLSENQNDIVRFAAKGAWSYFCELCISDNNYLPPDNYQVSPPRGTALRTSPTNIGMMLAGCVAAEKLGYASCSAVVGMIYNTLLSLDKLEKWNGHPYNWYDIKTLTPLEPKFVSSADNGNLACSLLCVREALIKYGDAFSLDELKQKSAICIKIISKILDGMDFSLLYDSTKDLLSVGYEVQNGKLSDYAYDLFASEARQASFYAVISGKVPVKHWGRLSREVVMYKKRFILKSWSGSMFEYLMPSIFMKTYNGTLSERAYKEIIAEQMLYAKRFNMPWGVSESGYVRFDDDMNYQYKAFGIPVAAKRGINGKENVIAPYACVLALPLFKKKSAENLIDMKKFGLCGVFGFYEACDITTGKACAVSSFMAHHEGMILLSAANALCDNCIVELFHNAAEVRAGEHLLQEKMPEFCPKVSKNYSVKPRKIFNNDKKIEEISYGVHTRPKLTGIADNGYGLVISESGSNYSHFDKIMLNKWQIDELNESYGHFIFIKDVDSGNVYSATPAPLYNKCNNFRTSFTPSKINFSNTCGGIQSSLDITVSGEHNATVFMLDIKNVHNRKKRIFVADYSEAALETEEEYMAHPQYSDMFIRTEYYKNTLFIRRFPRTDKAVKHFMAIVLGVNSGGQAKYMTSKYAFVGRNRSLRFPEFCDKNFIYEDGENTNISGCASLGYEVELLPNESIKLCYALLYAQNEDILRENAEFFAKIDNCEAVFSNAYERVKTNLSANNITQREYYLSNRIISTLYYPCAYNKNYVRPCNKSFLWKYGISGDLPIISLNVTDNYKSLKMMLKIYSFISNNGISSDLVIISNDDGYHAGNYEEIRRMAESTHLRLPLNRKGGIFVVRGEQNSSEIDLIESFAQVRLYGTPARIYSLLAARDKTVKCNGILRLDRNEGSPLQNVDGIEFFNGYGGFDSFENEYRILLNSRIRTPQPWSHILANEKFGTLVTESGGGFTWYINSRENKLTTWSNDPVTDLPSEVVYIKDEGNANVITAENLMHTYGEYEVRYGIGYAIYKHCENDISVTKTVFVPQNESVKVSMVNIANNSDKNKKISVYCYADCHLSSGISPNDEGITSFYNVKNGMLFSQNKCIPENGLMFMAADCEINEVMNSKREFFGRVSGIKNPKSLYIDSKADLALSSDCMVIKLSLEIKAHDSKCVTLLLGAADDVYQAEQIKRKFANTIDIRKIFEDIKCEAAKKLKPFEIVTADKTLDALFNNFLLYQVYICRYFAKTSFYQCSGAFGFRDQLQDTLAFMYCDKDRAREHILRCAAQQFEQGDVRHWWHESTGYGIRTKISDDMMFLPYVCCEYVRFTSDWQIFDEQVAFVKGQEIADGENTHFGKAFVSQNKESLYKHCILAIKRVAKFGEHGLLLIGTGDWNDGFDKVGEHGKGESIWLTFFVGYVIKLFRNVCERYNDAENTEYIDELYTKLKKGIDSYSWDGEWFRRAYYDDGTPLGSKLNDECKIDVIAQAWAAISGMTSPEKRDTALDSAEKHLVDKKVGIVKLFSPPFENSTQNPGYIKAYRSGLRENGGQYTHGVAWLIQAYAMAGNSKKAYNILKMLNPVNHTLTKDAADIYKVEPYVISADVYYAKNAYGMGGWSWYTGSAAWMYKIILEYILGIIVSGNRISLSENIPNEILPLRVNYNHKFGDSVTPYIIDMVQSSGKTKCIHDSVECDLGNIELFTDGKRHKIVLYLTKNI